MTITTTGTAPAVLRIQDSSVYLGVSLSFLYGLIRSGALPKIKLGARAAGVRRSDLDAWISTQASR